MSATEHLRTATTIVLLIRRRDPRAWPLAERLAELYQRRCVEQLLTSRGPASVFVPTTEDELEELFGEPDTRRHQKSTADQLRPARIRPVAVRSLRLAGS